MRFTLLLSTVLLFLATPALAQVPSQECGAPPPAEMGTDPGGHYCNLYTRRLAYSDEDSKFRDMIQQRRKNFVAPNVEVSRQYKKDLEARHNAYKSPTAGNEPAPESTAEPAAESFGPDLNH